MREFSMSLYFYFMANPLECDNGSLLLIQIHTVKKIGKQQTDLSRLLAFLSFIHMSGGKEMNKNIVQ